MEMEKVPAAGYRIVGLPIAGLQRKLSLSNLIHNLSLPFKLADSMRRASTIIEEFDPDVAIGVGRLRKRPAAARGREAPRAHSDTGAEQLRRPHQQNARKEGRQHLRGLRRHGKILPGRRR